MSELKSALRKLRATRHAIVISLEDIIQEIEATIAEEEEEK